MSRLYKAKDSQKQIIDYIKEIVEQLINIEIYLYFLVVIVVLPLYLKDDYNHISSNKYSMFKSTSLNIVKCLIPLLILYVVIQCYKRIKAQSMIKEKSALKRNSLFLPDIFAGIYIMDVFLSYFLSNYKEEALWGTKSWYIGLYTISVAIGSYFLISQLWKRWDIVPAVFVPVSMFIFILGILNRFSIFPIDFGYTGPDYISTIGNINWYCGYIVTVLFGGVYFLWSEKKSNKGAVIFWFVYSSIGFTTLITQGSNSALLALAAVFTILLACSFQDVDRFKGFSRVLLAFSLACLFVNITRHLFPEAMNYPDKIWDSITFSPITYFSCFLSIGIWMTANFLEKKNIKSKKLPFQLTVGLVIIVAATLIGFIGLIIWNTLNPGSLGILSKYSLFTFSSEWGSYRGATWMAGIYSFQELDIQGKLFGVGPNCMSAFLQNEGSDRINLLLEEAFSGSRLTNAHNEWLTVLVNTGIVGFISYVGFIISACIYLIKAGSNSRIAGACGICLVAYSANNFVSFQQIVNYTTVFVIVGIGMAYRDKKVVSGKERN